MTGVIRPMWSSASWRSFGSVERCATSLFSAVHTTMARAASLKARMVSRTRRTSGCTMIGSAGLAGSFGAGRAGGPLGAGQRAAARPGGPILHGVLIGDFGLCEALPGDAEAGLVHHH